MSDTGNNLEQVIEDSVNDATSPEPVESTPEVEYSTTTADTDGLTATTTEEPATEVAESQAPAPGAADPSAPVEDEFAKRFGLQGQSVTGRENRIPYSRVKKIVERAEKEARAAAEKTLAGAPQPKLQEYETKVKDYEGRLEKVAQFENMIEHQPEQFMNFLSTLPAYKEFFAYINQLAQQAPAASAQATAQPTLDLAGMPQPDQPLPDGTKVYSMEGLQQLLAWQAQQVEARAIKATEDRIAQRYKPMEENWQAEQRRQQAIPVIQKQLAEARQWPHFTELEADIVEVLKTDPNISLEGAYRKTLSEKVLPKLQTDRDSMRKSILEELKKKPVSTSAPTSAVKPTRTPAGPRSLEDIIKEAAESLKK